MGSFRRNVYGPRAAYSCESRRSLGGGGLPGLRRVATAKEIARRGTAGVNCSSDKGHTINYIIIVIRVAEERSVFYTWGFWRTKLQMKLPNVSRSRKPQFHDAARQASFHFP